MKIENLSLSTYRNINFLNINPSPYTNIIYGNNAQGKTNIIEAIWIFTGNSSFRGSRYFDLIMFENKYTQLKINFSDSKREQKATIDILNSKESSIKKVKLNGVDIKKIGELNGNFYAVVFSPSHLSLVTDGPKSRRKFLDIAISQIKPQYMDYLATYEKNLTQRNALLKSKLIHIEDLIDVWDIQIAKIGTIISIIRNDYVNSLCNICKNYYSGLSSKKEVFNLKYSSTVFDDIDTIKIYDDENIEKYYQKLKEGFLLDCKTGFTNYGIHRDDLEIYVEEMLVKSFGSQGQQRSSVITLKLGEATLLKGVTGENPIMLLDDVMSELDEKRQNFILNNLSDMQVFITCCDKENIKKLKKGRIFEVKDGEIVFQRDIE